LAVAIKALQFPYPAAAEGPAGYPHANVF